MSDEGNNYTISFFQGQGGNANTGPLRHVHDLYTRCIASLEPAYRVPQEHFISLLSAANARTFVALQDTIPVGFCLTYTSLAGASRDPACQHLKGGLALIAVDDLHRGEGIGSALHSEAVKYLEQTLRESFGRSTPAATESEIIIGSWFPRFFPGVPQGPEFDPAKEWLSRRGWAMSQETGRDMYRKFGGPEEDEALRAEMKALMKRAEDQGIRFGRPEEKDDEALVAFQMAEFGKYIGWPDAFPKILSLGLRDDILCVFDKDGQIVGATIAGLSDGSGRRNLIDATLAFAGTLSPRTGMIAAVGISSKCRTGGVGTAMVAAATLRLRERGAEAIFIDWIADRLEGFYGRVGYTVWERKYVGGKRLVTAV